MTDNKPNSTTSSDEIDLGQLLKMIANGFNRVGIAFLRVFLYLKRNALILIGLIVLGVVISFVLSMLGNEKLKSETIVRPNFDSTDYVYDAIAEIQSNIYSQDTAFFQKMGISVQDLKGFRIDIQPISDLEEAKEKEEQELRYLELLESFKEESFVVDIVRSELTKKSILAHRVTFTYIDADKGTEAARKILDYINGNAYYDKVIKTFKENAQMRIDKNTGLIAQIDQLLENYSKTLLREGSEKANGSVYMENESALNIASLLTLKNDFLKEIEEKKAELTNQGEILSIINMGNPQVFKKPFFNDKFFLVPMALVVLFFVISFIRFLNRRAKELQL
ncbi:hypothetical protein Q4603_11075 [Zobellia galactanivorans]|uniref:Conserved hypothetical membrane protein n=1 Tax=Zobellia galactanivorans (strain DSM 12802 / CCUG 47099 / CIP 106680 / NCIMB 13871 / Dsij) TaxID=63186 RepID=G0LB51_ZOBGA|nr:hypothetical protein [Zobellia galactanivorans]MDO6809158.1 hypothetical protein [Zobellia galactanivorans]CAZ95786.1 Conserved hypothetical membrane protein [Zobellia galactanivorans]